MTVSQKKTSQKIIIERIDSVSIPVSNLEKAVEFYTHVLNFKKTTEETISYLKEGKPLSKVTRSPRTVVRLKLGEECIEIIEFPDEMKGRPIPDGSRSNDRWFQHVAIIVKDMKKAYAILKKNKVRHVSSVPQRLPDRNPNAGGIWAFYFLDPDGHVLEILQFPDDKGQEKWHLPSDELFLGIDHTAIVVKNSSRSLEFYQGALGFQELGESDNDGPEQEKLNHVKGVRLHITGLGVGKGMNVEFLEYRYPQDGCDYPDVQMNDLYAWVSNFIVKDIDALEDSFIEAQTDWLTPGIISRKTSSQKLSSEGIIRDPDGHLIRLM